MMSESHKKNLSDSFIRKGTDAAIYTLSDHIIIFKSMSKRNQRETRSLSSSSSQYQPSPKRLLRDGTPGKDDDHVSLSNIMDKLCHLESRMEDLFGSLKSELSCLRHELNKEIEQLKSTVNDMETSWNAVWDTIKDLQDELKIHAEFRKKHKESLEKHLEDNHVA